MSRNIWLCGWVVAFVVLVAGSASGAERRIAVVPFEGEAASRSEAVLYQALSGRYVVIPAKQVEKGIAEVGGLHENSRDSYAALSKKVSAHAIVSGNVSHDTKWRLRLTVREGTTGVPVGSAVWTRSHLSGVSSAMNGPAKSWLLTLLAKTGSNQPIALSDSSAAAAAKDSTGAPLVGVAAEAAPSTAADSAPASRAAAPIRAEGSEDEGIDGRSKKKAPQKTPLFEIAAGPRLFSRTFTYTDNLSRLRGYNIAGAFGVGAEADAYPLAHRNTGFNNLGVAASYETSIGTRTQGRDPGTSYETKISAYRVGARYRIPLSQLLFTFGLDYGQHRFDVGTEVDVPPNVVYRFVRPSAAFRTNIVSALSIGLAIGYSNVMSVGGLSNSDRFPRITAVGADAAATIGYLFDMGIDLKLVADLRYYAHTMHAQAGDRYVVGGAVDAHVGTSLLVGYPFF